MKKLIVLVLLLLLIFQIFPAFGEKQPESCCSHCSHIAVGAKNSNDHDCQVIGQGIRQCCPDMSLRTTTYSKRFSDFHRVDGDLCEITTVKTYEVEKCSNCGAVHSRDLINTDIRHSHPSCPS